MSLFAELKRQKVVRVGIPVAVFFDPEGVVIGTTNEGQLEPARR
jgi:hypothetical protein